MDNDVMIMNMCSRAAPGVTSWTVWVRALKQEHFVLVFIQNPRALFI